MTAANDAEKDAAGTGAGPGPQTPGQAPGRPAEKRPRTREAPEGGPLPPGEAGRLLQEMEARQIELEMQNEALRRAQDALQASQARYFDLYDQAPIGYIDLDGKGLILEANLTAAGLLGVAKKSLANRPLGRFVLPAQQSRYYRHRRRLFASGEPQTCELCMRRGDGTRFWARLQATLARDAASGAARCRIILSDITDRRQAEEQAARSQARMRAIVDTASSGIITINQKGVVVTANAAAARLFGYAEEELAGRDVSVLMPSPHRERHGAYIASYLETGESKIIGVGRDVVGQRKDGSTFPARLGIGEFQEGGERFFTGIVQDTSEQEKAGEQRRQLQLLIEHSSDLIAMADLGGRVTYMNKAGRRMVGLAEDEDPGRWRLADHIAPESPEPLQTATLSAAGGPGQWEGEMRLRKLGDGAAATLEVSSSIFLVRDGAGNAVGLGTVTRDITQRKRAEAALRASEAFALAVMNSVSAEIAVLDRGGRIVAVNEPWRRFALQNRAGPAAPAPRTDVGADYLAICRDSDGESAAGAMAAHDGILAVLQGRAPSFACEYPCHSADEQRWFAMAVTPLEEARGGAVVSHAEITLRKRAEEALELQRQLLEMVASGTPLPLTLDALLRKVERQAPGMLTSILLLDAGGARLRHAAAPSLPGGYARAIDGIAVGEGQGSCGTAAFRREPVIAEDIACDPLWAGYRGLAAAFGLRASWAHPILDAAGAVLGTFAIYYPFPARPTPHHRGLIGLAVHVAAIAIARHREEQALRDSEERLSFAMDASGEGVWDWDIPGGRAVHNRTWFELLGLDADAPAPTPAFFGTLLHGDDRAAVLARIQQALDGDGKYRSEHRLRRADGQYIWVQEHGTVVKRDAAGKPLRMVGSFADIGERRKGEQALRDSEERLSLVMEAAEIGTWDWDLRAGTLVCSPRCLALFGLPPDTPVDYPRFLELLHPEDREAADQAVRAALRSREDYQAEMRTRWPDGSVHWVASRGRVYCNAEGLPVRMSGAALDLTEHKRAERQLRERQLESENYMRLQVANQTVAAIAHELNQPLNAIASYSAGALRLLKADAPPLEKLAQAFEQSAKQALRAGQVIRELLAFLRAGETVTEPLDLNGVVYDTLVRLKADGLFEGFKASMDLAEPLPKVQANQAQVEKVLVNLVRNGIEAMREAGLPAGTINVTARAGADGDFAQVTVRDSGPGLAGASIHQVFEPFFTTKPHGLGMGLAISRALVEAHGGELWAEQDAEPGAGFHFTLPFAPGAPP